MTSDTLIRKPKVLNDTGLKNATLYRLIKAGKFPAPVKISARAAAWSSLTVQKWIDDRIQASLSNKGAK